MNSENKNFALIGLGGYIAPKHVEAIKKNACKLICSLDINDSVGFIENYYVTYMFFSCHLLISFIIQLIIFV